MSLQGTTQAYNVMDSTYLALAPSCDDKIFGTNINYCDLTRWGIVDGEENNLAILNEYLKYRKNSVLNFPPATEPSKSSTSTTVLSMLDAIPEVSNFRAAVYKSGWAHYLDHANPMYKVTIFAPINSGFNVNNLRQSPYDLRALMQAHTLSFGFEQESAYDRKLRLYTTLPSFSLYIDGTGEVSNKLNLYTVSDELLTLQFPKPIKRINILQAYYTNNGAVYVIEEELSRNAL
jgi:hypothetical protein